MPPIVAKDGTNVPREENDVTIKCWLTLLLSKTTQLCHCQVHFLISLCLAMHLITNKQFCIGSLLLPSPGQTDFILF
jgi:hypothetical protein